MGAGIDETAFARLVDKDLCREVLAAYGPACDWLDEAALARVFWPDADIDYGFFKGKGSEFVPLLIDIEQRNPVPRRFHMASCERIKLAGDRAHAESFGVTQSMTQDETGNPLVRVYFGRYIDELEKRDGEWRIAKRTYLLNAVMAAPPAPPSAALTQLNWADATNTMHPLYF